MTENLANTRTFCQTCCSCQNCVWLCVLKYMLSVTSTELSSFIAKCLLQVVVAKLAVALACLYFFVCSLSFLATAFRLLSGRSSGKIFANTELLQGHNPVLASLIYMVTKQAPVKSHFVAIKIGI